ncbi:MAG: peptidoglycan DD-metalloendopeptidase family protein [Prevotellaceae bacterium]|jgi:murein DD-endopeptidase MepM/ murein hydrolase activator NlpD|nr:peptidoglycan DD-metalloendopeptidase family protein [Prevotellaceae bacterium]
MIFLGQKKFITLLISLMLFPISGLLYAQQLEMLIDERKQAEKDMEHLNNLLKSIEGSQKAGLQELTLIKKKIDSRKQILSNIDKQINVLGSDLGKKQKDILILQDDLKSIQKSYSDLLLRYYKIRNKNDWMMYIMASESVTQAYKRMRYFREILMLLQAQADEIISMTYQLNEEIVDMARKQQLLQDNINDKLKEVNTLESEQKQSQTVLSSLQKREAEIRKQLQEKEHSFNQLSSSLKDFYRSEAEKGIDISTGDMQLLTERFEANRGFLPWPAMGTVISSFGKHNHPVYKEIKLPENFGIDIQTPKNAEVYSVFSGVVAQIIKVPQTGEKNIVIRHGAYTTVYFKVDNIFIKIGDEVKLRQKIATVASTSEGSVLHFEIRKTNQSGNNVPINPENWIMM